MPIHIFKRKKDNTSKKLMSAFSLNHLYLHHDERLNSYLVVNELNVPPRRKQTQNKETGEL